MELPSLAVLSEKDWLVHFPTISPEWWNQTVHLFEDIPRPQIFYSYVPAERSGLPYLNTTLHGIIGHLDAGNILIDPSAAHAQNIEETPSENSGSSFILHAAMLAKRLTELVGDDTAWESTAAFLSSHAAMEGLLIELHRAWLSVRTTGT